MSIAKDVRDTLEAAGVVTFAVPGGVLGDRSCYVSYEGVVAAESGQTVPAFAVSVYLSIAGLPDPESDLEEYSDAVCNALTGAGLGYSLSALTRDDDAEAGYMTMRIEGYRVP